MSEFRTFAINAIALGALCQMRSQSSQDVIAEYADIYRLNPDQMPPPKVFLVAGSPQTIDGYHRVTAAAVAGLEFLRCEIAGEGTPEDAVWAACAANLGHGLRRTNADKRRAVEAALGLRSSSSDRAIAAHVGVSADMVGSVRASIHQAHTVGVSENDTHTSSHKPKRVDARGVERPATKPRRVEPEEPAWSPPPAKKREEPPAEVPDCRTWLEAADVLKAARLECKRLLPDEKFNRLEHALKTEESLLRASVLVSCPHCAGRKCKQCQQRGWMPASQAREAVRHA